MNSSEIARLAGVSVRALRHYHQVGVLPEPARRANGYREYTVSDLVLLLRIRRLAELGIPLDEIPPMLSASGRDHTVLEELDRELADQIERLTARREVIAQLRAARADPDTPPELAGLLASIGGGGPDLPPQMLKHDREVMMLLHHLLDDKGRTALTGLLSQVTEPDLLAAITALTARFAALGPDTGDEEIDRLVADYHLVLGHLSFDGWTKVDPRTNALLTSYQETVLNGTQREFLARLVGVDQP
ncbi:MerR family transcriptional regulator [Micromonospora endolithica]|uniref:MerR family transcriptional regulator n=1 Tax=Micromonospora endolithica TaxID=230091 RepID=A0A3A9ZGE0_9ACTN|nr:MerR family transcriptional regulator [Micromonospora endolithica]RKN47581.1 MerR family transcriptional regulator [Micromonospora endolithica]TWJ21228.1 DNA-binding transcriptional MerR regulator [Micromonospora endolithica]